MRYTRSSFITWLTKTCKCDVKPLANNPNVLIIKYFNETTKMYMTGKDIIDYEEIYIHYKKLYLPDLPGEKDLERIED